ncbi:MAG: elongation factor G [Thermoanaerobaculia bacterium]
MKAYRGSEIHNLAVVGHNDTGKTTLLSQLLFNAGAVTRLGSVLDGTTVTDFDADEIERQHSISAAVAHAEWNDRKINLIDTPGFGIFLMEAKGALRVADAAAVVVSAVTGVEVSTEKVWKFAGEFALPALFVANKMDRDRASAERTFESLQRKFGKSVVPVQLPIGSEKDFRGVVDLITMKAYVWETDGSGKFTAGEIPAELKEAASSAREQLIEKVAEGDDTLMERFFEEGGLSQEELVAGLRREIRAREIFPLVYAASSHNIGGQAILDLILQLMPTAAEGGEVRGTIGGEEVALPRTDDAPVSALVFKTTSDPFAGRVSLLRVYSGTLKSDTTYLNTGREHDERVGKLQVLQGKQQTAVGELHAGDIGGVAKLKDTHTGDTIASKEKPLVLQHIVYPEPLISFAIEPKSKGDDDKISTAMARIMEEDPTIRYARDEQTKEFLISGQGQLHVEVIVGKLKKKYGVDVILHQPKVPYRETITRPADAHGRHKKQSGGHGQFADCKIKIEPLPRGGEFEFVDEIFGGSIPRQFIPAVEKGIQEARAQGYLAGFPVVDFRVRLLDGQFHTVDSSELAFKIAGALAFKEGMAAARPTLLEPVMHVEVYTPNEYVGDLMGDLTSRRGKMEGIESESDAQVIRATVPMAEMLTYGSTLRSITQGRGSFHMEFSHYEEVPRNLQEKVIAEAKKAEAEHHA